MKSNEINFLDVTNDGLYVGRSPNGENEMFMDYVVARGTKLIQENDIPPTPEFQLVCLLLNETAENPFFLD